MAVYWHFFCAAHLGRPFASPRLTPLISRICVRFHVSLVANTDLYSLVTERGAFPYEGVIVTHVVSLIRSEDLDPARDFAPLQRFAQALVRSSGRDGAGFLQLVSLVPSLGDVGQPAP